MYLLKQFNKYYNIFMKKISKIIKNKLKKEKSIEKKIRMKQDHMNRIQSIKYFCEEIEKKK